MHHLLQSFLIAFLAGMIIGCGMWAQADTKRTETFEANLSAYCACYKCCNKRPGDPGYGITASGKQVKVGMCAADKSIPFGSRIQVEGLGTYVVEDRGGAIKGNKIDIYFPNHNSALQFGRQKRTVTVYYK